MQIQNPEHYRLMRKINDLWICGKDYFCIVVLFAKACVYVINDPMITMVSPDDGPSRVLTFFFISHEHYEVHNVSCIDLGGARLTFVQLKCKIDNRILVRHL